MPLDISRLDFNGLIGHEWLEVNGIGGYACSTLCGMNTRKYHGLLVAAMSPPVRRMVLLSHVDETVFTAKGSAALSSNEYPSAVSPQGYRLLRAFSAEPFPRWAFQGDGFTIEKSVRLLPGENCICLSYCLLTAGQSVDLEVRPMMALRPIHELTYQWNGRLIAETREKGRLRIPATARTPEVFFAFDGEFQGQPYWYLNTIYRREQERGYAGLEDLWSPGTFRWTLSPGQSVNLVCSAEPVECTRVCGDLERIRVDLDRRAASGSAGQTESNLAALTRAASAFVVNSENNVGVIGQYPWSSPNVRSALIGFTGLFLSTGRFDEARRMLSSLATKLSQGLIPTEFPEDGSPPRYMGADTSLWFIHAIAALAQASPDDPTVAALWPAIENILASYQSGTNLGISCDAEGLIASRASGIPTSWMDAKLGDWVITPRAGRTVSLNALWYSALRSAANLAERFGKPQPATEWNNLAQRVSESFNRRFWNAARQCCFDVVEDNSVDASVRPNQILAMSLPFPVLAHEKFGPVIEVMQRELLTPMGVRSLSPRDVNYQGRYTGNVVARDKAQHQGSVYPWLLGPLAIAYLRLHGRDPAAILQVRQWLQGCLNYLQGDGVGQLCELFDGDAPHNAGGAIASALNVGEILRCYAQDVMGLQHAESARPAPTPVATDEPAATFGKP